MAPHDQHAAPVSSSVINDATDLDFESVISIAHRP
jgi:hypothetical protein